MYLRVSIIIIIHAFSEKFYFESKFIFKHYTRKMMVIEKAGKLEGPVTSVSENDYATVKT